jgi:VCBS repeat-containing protein
VTTTGALTGTYGTLTLNADGTYTYTVDNNNATVQALRTTANTLTDTFSHTMRDTAGATSTATLTVTIRGANDAPTDIALSNSSVAENAGANAVVGTLSATDADTGDTFTFSLPAGVGDNAAFNISGTQLRANASFDFETQSSYSATVRVTDQVGQTFDKLFTVTVTNVNEAPTIAAPASAFVLQNTNLTFTDISVADVDVGGGQLTVALTATHGTLTLGSTAGLSGLSGNNTAAVGFSGTLAAVNAALNGLTFHPEANYSGPASLGINVNDQGNTGTGGSLSAARTVAINVSPFPSVTNVQVGTPVAGFANQRSRIDQLVVTFSESLAQHPDAAFSLVRTGGPAVPLTVTWNADFSRATLTFSGPNVAGGSLTDGRYRLTVDGGQLITTSGQAIDGDGDHLGGGAFVLDFHRLFGDADGDADTDFTDLARFRQALGGPSVNPFIAYNPIFDSDGDGDVDFTDLAQFRQRLGTVLP